ncbi:MAG TPA: NADH-quinone oxidoreductase subunit L [Planctomycetaceae bacterium]|nr:NADH-quinone oxidoreductase subunit L [Planctomycetaceae bacterium]HIQ19873.1 NADH-quinone oxidoreductase subunit L [Planctomycetota bacterium]
MRTLAILIPALPLAAALVTAVLGKRVLRGASHWPSVAAIGLAWLASMALLIQVHRRASETAQQKGLAGYEQIIPVGWTWAAVDRAYLQSDLQPGAQQAGFRFRSFRIAIELRADPLTAVMLATVTFVSFLVAVYSVGYMHSDPGYWRFFTYINLFVFSMTMLVSVSNFLLLYVFWEAVGLCSYLLIGFWFRKPEAAAAGKKAFLVNRVGDFGFALGVFLLWITYGTLNFHDGADGTLGILGLGRLAGGPGLFVSGATGTAICLLLMLGACGKSAQLPLHVWLPDAMEGPTPVSALIHAATMVTAGVYMVARCSPLFVAGAGALEVVAVIGGLTALMAAIIAITQTDLKRILAYSTISQLGYMFLGLGAGTRVGITAGMFHLFTHAFFKALLFLGAGSVMHAMGGVIDIRRFGGLRRRLPVTHWTFLFGCLALAGLIPFAGFFSKDEILAAVHARAETHLLYEILYLAGIFTALLTAFYTFRAYFVTFHGAERIPEEAGEHAHESPRWMTVPLVILAIGSLVLGALFWWTEGFAHFLAKTPSLGYVTRYGWAATEGGSHLAVAVTSTLVAVAGIGLAWFLYPNRRQLVEQLARAADRVALYRLSAGKFFFDPLYLALVVRPLEGLARFSYAFDRYVIDTLVDGIGRMPVRLGASLRWSQGGMIKVYALGMVLGLLVLLGAMLW